MKIQAFERCYTTGADVSCALYISVAKMSNAGANSKAFAQRCYRVSFQTNLIGWFLRARISSFVMSQRHVSVAKRKSLASDVFLRREKSLLNKLRWEVLIVLLKNTEKRKSTLKGILITCFLLNFVLSLTIVCAR